MWISTFHAACVRMLRRNVERIGYRPGFTHLRRRRQPPARRARPRRPRHRPEALPAPGGARCDQPGEVGPARRRGATRQRAGTRSTRSGSPRPTPSTSAASSRRTRWTSTTCCPHGAPVPRAPRRARALPGPLRARARRRVPGHQRGPERARHPARREARRNVCVVGDTDQSIYRFRGAEMRNLLEFERAFPEATRHRARPELPLHPDDPRRRQRRHRQQLAPPGEATSGARSARASRIRRYRAGDERDEATFVTNEIALSTATRASRSARSPSSTGPTPRAGRSRRRSPIGGSPTR